MDYIFIGSGEFAAQVLAFLNPGPLLVITKPDRLGGRGMKTVLPSPVKTIAAKKGIAIVAVHDATELQALLEQHASVPVVLTDFGMIIPDKLLTISTHGIWNIHPSMLPHYRGSTPLQNAILNGDTSTGVTVIQIDAQVDHGPVLAQQSAPLSSDETTQTLSYKLAEMGAALIQPLLANPHQAISQAYQQNHTQATLTKKITKEDGYIAIEKLRPYLLPILTKYNLPHILPADSSVTPIEEHRLHALIRALAPWPGVWTKSNNTVLKLLGLSVAPEGYIVSRLQLGNKTYTLE